MQPEFWHQRWSENQIGFHESTVNPLLVAHFDALGLPAGARVFLPLCGKTLDIDWLLSRGHRVVGAELSALAVKQLFERLGREPDIQSTGALARWTAGDLDVLVGDFFDLEAASLGDVDAVFDRAALIALPLQMRRRYAARMQSLVPRAPALLITLNYDQRQMEGPPFAVSDEEVRECFPDRKPLELARQQVPGGLKGKCPAEEIVWRV